jgi:membrane-bound lytic murein transglycosylase B
MKSALSVVGVLVLASWLAVSSAGASRAGFADWLEALRTEAHESGISEATITASLAGVEPVGRILELDRSQPGAPAEFCEYLEKRLTDTRIERGRRMLEEHRAVLRAVGQEYGVAPRFVIALWGLETNFGDYVGDYRVIDALATLAYDERRGAMFRRQLLAALRIVDQGHQQPTSMKGSWAGAMGQVQFMPSTYRAYAVDHDGDGRKDIWSSVPDALASAANYLSNAGWRRGETWGRRVEIPSGLQFDGRTSDPQSLAEWSRLGVRSYGGLDLPSAKMRGSIVLPVSKPRPAFLVYRNYRAILAWNRSTFFGISVGTLADRVVGRTSPRLCVN